MADTSETERTSSARNRGMSVLHFKDQSLMRGPPERDCKNKTQNIENDLELKSLFSGSCRDNSRCLAALVMTNEKKSRCLAALVMTNEKKSRCLAALVMTNEKKSRCLAALVMTNEKKS